MTDLDKAIADPALDEFMEYFRRNYPGPDTVIGRPDWHSPKIFRAAVHAMKQSGALIPAVEREAAVAAALERAGDIARIRAEQHADMVLESEPESARLREAMESAFTEMRWAIRALITQPQSDALAALSNNGRGE